MRFRNKTNRSIYWNISNTQFMHPRIRYPNFFFLFPLPLFSFFLINYSEYQNIIYYFKISDLMQLVARELLFIACFVHYCVQCNIKLYRALLCISDLWKVGVLFSQSDDMFFNYHIFYVFNFCLIGIQCNWRYWITVLLLSLVLLQIRTDLMNAICLLELSFNVCLLI
jgi:hypothetical protein